MIFTENKIKGLYIIEPKLWRDDRGYFYESYSKKYFEDEGIIANFVQDNQSLSQKGTLRGLHAQKNPSAQGKLVRVIRGSVMGCCS
jgi:dTDP-4-dehydrorhamnose 3,5-epimerase